MKCKNCGQENSDEEEFCSCGFHLNYKRYDYDEWVPYKTHWYRSENFYLKIVAFGAVLMLALIYVITIEPF